MNKIFPLKMTDPEAGTISARELHERLNIQTRFSDWFNRVKEYGFIDGEDFYSILSKTPKTMGRPSTDFNITLNMAKEICMLQKTAEGRAVRQYLIDLERKWNSPEVIMARALKLAQSKIEVIEEANKQLMEENERMKPKEVFADAVRSTNDLILIRDMAKLLNQNGYDTGERRLYETLRNLGYICKTSKMPTQRAMDMGIFKVVETTVDLEDRQILSMTTKVTPKGQIFLINKFKEVANE